MKTASGGFTTELQYSILKHRGVQEGHLLGGPPLSGSPRLPGRHSSAGEDVEMDSGSDMNTLEPLVGVVVSMPAPPMQLEYAFWDMGSISSGGLSVSH